MSNTRGVIMMVCFVIFPHSVVNWKGNETAPMGNIEFEYLVNFKLKTNEHVASKTS